MKKEDSVIRLVLDLSAIKKLNLISDSVYLTILGQIRHGDISGAAKGINRIIRKNERRKKGD